VFVISKPKDMNRIVKICYGHLCLSFLKCFLKSVDRRPVSKCVCHVYEVAINLITIHNWRSRIGFNESSPWQLDWHPTNLALGVRLVINKKPEENKYGYECFKLDYISMSNIIINIPHRAHFHYFKYLLFFL
jgi:hypothetical protein